MQNPFRRYKRSFWTADRKSSLYEGVALLAVAVFIQVFAGQYSAIAASGAHYVNDIMLDNLPFVNLDFMIVGGGIVLWILAFWLLIVHPTRLVFGIKAIALFIIARAFFFSLTHVGPYPVGVPPGPQNFGWGLYKFITFQGNFFFSGHTGFPLLMALLFWDHRDLRWFFIAAATIFGASVLLSHVHYSIDVFAAPFIVYGIYKIAERVFDKDFAILTG